MCFNESGFLFLGGKLVWSVQLPLERVSHLPCMIWCPDMSEVPGYPVPQHGDAQPPGFFSMVHKRTFVLARMVAIGDNWGGCPFHMTCNALSRDVALISERVTPAGWMFAQFSGGSLGLKWKVPGDGVARTSDIPWKHMRKRQILARYGTAGFRTVADVLDPAAWLQETQVHSTQHRFLLASRFLHGLAGVVAVVAHTNPWNG